MVTSYIIFHIIVGNAVTALSLLIKWEDLSIQYSAVLAVTGAWKSISREKLNYEPGWELLNLR